MDRNTRTTPCQNPELTGSMQNENFRVQRKLEMLASVQGSNELSKRAILVFPAGQVRDVERAVQVSDRRAIICLHQAESPRI